MTRVKHAGGRLLGGGYLLLFVDLVMGRVCNIGRGVTD